MFGVENRLEFTQSKVKNTIRSSLKASTRKNDMLHWSKFKMVDMQEEAV